MYIYIYLIFYDLNVLTHVSIDMFWPYWIYPPGNESISRLGKRKSSTKKWLGRGVLVPRKVFFQCQVFNARERTWWNIPGQHLLQNSFCFGWKKPTIRRSCFIMFIPYVALMPNLKGMRFQLHVGPSNAMNWLALRQSDPPVLSLCSWRKSLEWHLPSEPTAPRLATTTSSFRFLASWEKCNYIMSKEDE